MTVKKKYNKIILALPFILFVLTGISFAWNKSNIDTLAVVGKKIKSTIRLFLLTGEGINYSAAIELKNNWQDIEIPLNQLKNNYALILPFSYPQFLPKIWDGKDTANTGYLSPGKIEFVQIVCDKSSAKINNGKMETGFEIESIYLKTINKDWRLL